MSSPSGLSDSSEFSGNTVLIFFGIFVPIQIVCVALRFWSRYIVKASWGADDVFVAVSLFLQLVQAGLCIGQSILGLLLFVVPEVQTVLIEGRWGEKRWARLPYPLSRGNTASARSSVAKVACCNRHRLLPQHFTAKDRHSVSV